MPIDYHKIPSPAYVLDEQRLIANLELIRSVQDKAGVDIILALKGFSMWKVFPLVKKYLKGATASSLNEARLICEEMGAKAHTYSPAFLDQEFDDLLGLSSHITFNSVNQFYQYRDRAIAKGVSCGIRVNPEYSDVETDLYNPASPDSRLGITSEHLTTLPEGIDGFHFHTLCESSAQALEETLKALESRFGRFLSHLKWLNIGGGHLMTRKNYDIHHLIDVLKKFNARYQNLKIIMEPGSAIAWETGELVSSVLDIVENNGVKTAILDVSFTAHMPDTLEMPYRPKVLGASDPQPGKPTYRLGGVSCLAGDFMEAYSFEKPLAIGDKVIFWDMIHYTMVKTTTFNGVKHPDIGIWRQEQWYDLVKQFTYEDFKNRLS